jgi:hypothetical protein
MTDTASMQAAVHLIRVGLADNRLHLASVPAVLFTGNQKTSPRC